jgi:branched-chain amino acid transport system permease protein
MVYGILGLINFAHGEVVMIGALVALTVIKLLANSGLPGMCPGGADRPAGGGAGLHGLGYTIERIAYRPLRNAPRLAPLITAIGVSIVLQNLAMIIWGRNTMPSRRCCRPAPCIDIPRRPHHRLQIASSCSPALMMAGLMLLVQKPGWAAPCAPRRRIRRWPG